MVKGFVVFGIKPGNFCGILLFSVDPINAWYNWSMVSLTQSSLLRANNEQLLDEVEQNMVI